MASRSMGDSENSTRMRAVPSVNSILEHGSVQTLVEEFSRPLIVGLIRVRLEELRVTIASDASGQAVPDVGSVAADVAQRAAHRWRSRPDPVINATGVILHTNLGRAPLSADAVEAMTRVAASYTDLELDLDSGKRGSRQTNVARLLCDLTGAEAALVVNNNASAMLLGLAATADGREVIVSRGEAVEIGGGFRIPDVLRQSGAKLVEVGTTNRTYARDFASAITDDTGAILSVHASNFRVVGFAASPTTAELVAAGRERGVPVLHDLGSGCLLDTTAFGLAPEPMPQSSIEAGVDLAFFSGDKLLGGPQAGIVVGRWEAVARLAAHPLARAFRIDKISMAALEATLLHFLRGEATERVPVWRMIAASESDLGSTARRWRDAAGEAATVERGRSAIGGGSLPDETMPTWVVSIDATGRPGGAVGVARRLREANPPVMGRIDDERVLLDPRTVLPGQEQALVDGLKAALASEDGP